MGLTVEQVHENNVGIEGTTGVFIRLKTNLTVRIRYH